MHRQLTSASTLDALRKEAKRWLKALRAHDPAARARLDRAHPDAPPEPGLRDVQHALAREHGLSGWTALRARLAEGAHDGAVDAALVARFLAHACPDHHVRGGPAHLVARAAAERLLQRHPALARASIHTAVVCGELAEVERLVAERPEAAVERGGPKEWTPLLYLCFTRLPLAASSDAAVAIARLLLDHGADPNAYFMAGDSRYTPLVGVVGEGEENRPPHPRRDELARLLLERGAEPYDTQVVYDIHFRGDVLWFLRTIHEHALRLGRHADWDDPRWAMLDMGGYGCGARWHLDVALRRDDIALAEWALTHGASANAAPASDPRFAKRTLLDEARRRGLGPMAELLQRHGATSDGAALDDEDAYLAACLRLDADEARRLVDAHPEYLERPTAMFAAAEGDRADVAALLLDLGTSPDVHDAHGKHALHVAAYADAARVTALLVERGARVDAVDAVHDGTPLWWAVWGQRPRTIDVLRRVSRDPWALAFVGDVARLREVLRAEPALARMAGESTPLMWLPPDEPQALEIVELLLAHGADPSLRRKPDGRTAAEIARERGMDAAAARLEREPAAAR